MSAPTYRNFTGTAAENYERYFVPTIATAVSTDLLGTAGLRPGERVVDVACGTGLIARKAASLVGASGSVTGVDVAADMIEVARAAAPAGPPEISWHVSDAAALPLPSESCDVALCQMGLMFMGDRVGALREMQRVLVPDGRVVVNTPGTIQPPFELLERAIADHVAPELGEFVGAVFSMPEPGALTALLEEAGFREAEATVAIAHFVLPSPSDFLWQYVSLTPLAPFVAEAPASARSTLERAMVDGAEQFVDDGHLVLDQPMVVARACRGGG